MGTIAGDHGLRECLEKSRNVFSFFVDKQLNFNNLNYSKLEN